VAGVQITHATKVLYPGQGITKGDLARYYEAVADRMLPHVAGRPLMILRCPEGHTKPCFHQKHVTATVSPQIRSVPIKEGGKTTRTLMVEDTAGLIALVQMGTLELHVWGSRAERLEYPDRLIFDLDPDLGMPWRRVIEAARLLRDRLADLGLESWVKTTGGKGLHVVAPLAPKQDWPTVKAFARAMAENVAKDSPDRYTSNMSKAHRKGKIFLDYLRNGRGATAVATYSTRARAGAPVSWPVAWEELSRLDPQQFTVTTAPRHLAKWKADPWQGFDRTRQSITQAMLRRMEEQSG
jgi:bifunctional non-homologous end joining protein LigD